MFGFFFNKFRSVSISLYTFPEAVAHICIDMLVHGGFGWLLGWQLHIPYSFSYEQVTPQSSDLASLNSGHDSFPQTTREINKWLKSSGVKGRNEMVKTDNSV